MTRLRVEIPVSSLSAESDLRVEAGPTPGATLVIAAARLVVDH